MKFIVTTSETTSKIFEVEAESEEKAKALDGFKELISSTKTISWEIVDVDEIE